LAFRRIIKKHAPAWALSAARGLYHHTYRAILEIRFHASDVFGWKPQGQPFPPARLRFRVSENIDAKTFLAVGRNAAGHVVEALTAAQRSITDGSAVLEFGCGCGRVLVPLAQKFPACQFFGTDVDAEAIDWCARHYPSMGFRSNQEFPPLSYGSATFDLIYCVSVFTHLDDLHTRRWLSELRRILKPGGTLLITIHGEHVWQRLGAAQQEDLRSAGFLFESTEKLKGIQPDWYQTSYHASAYILALVSEQFRVLAHLPQGMGYQDVIVAAL
jgi:SAM-dependent methyltransferase